MPRINEKQIRCEKPSVAEEMSKNMDKQGRLRLSPEMSLFLYCHCSRINRTDTSRDVHLKVAFDL